MRWENENVQVRDFDLFNLKLLTLVEDSEGSTVSPAKRGQDFSSMHGISTFLEKKAELEMQRMELEQRKLDFEAQKWEAFKAHQSAQTDLLLELIKQQKRN